MGTKNNKEEVIVRFFVDGVLKNVRIEKRAIVKLKRGEFIRWLGSLKTVTRIDGKAVAEIHAKGIVATPGTKLLSQYKKRQPEALR